MLQAYRVNTSTKFSFLTERKTDKEIGGRISRMKVIRRKGDEKREQESSENKGRLFNKEWGKEKLKEIICRRKHKQKCNTSYRFHRTGLQENILVSKGIYS
jgi:hypothetical protein